MRPCVVLFEQVFSPIPSEISPDTVDVIGTVLSIVAFDEETGAMQSVVMRPAPFC